MFVTMALLYPWATKEYLLWECTIGQIILYHNLGLELKYGKPEGEKPTLRGKSYAELKAIREDMKRQGLIEEQQKADELKESFREKYGEV